MTVTEMPVTVVERSLASLRRDGWCVIEEVIPSSDAARVRDSVMATLASDDYEQGRNFVASNSDFVRYLPDQRVLGVVEGALGPLARVAFTGPIIRQPGEARGGWHSDWPFGGGGGAYIAAPYPDAVFYLTTIWMLSPFSPETGGTVIVPGSHRSGIDPQTDPRVDESKSHPTEIRVTGDPGSVMMFDSRMWHAKPNNDSENPRVAMRVCFAPWWLNLDYLDPDSEEGRVVADEAGAGRATASPPMPKVPGDVFEAMPADVQPLFRHWVKGGYAGSASS